MTSQEKRLPGRRAGRLWRGSSHRSRMSWDGIRPLEKEGPAARMNLAEPSEEQNQAHCVMTRLRGKRLKPEPYNSEDDDGGSSGRQGAGKKEGLKRAS